MKSKEKIAIPRTSNIPAPGQCIILNKIPILVNAIDIGPVMKTSFFIFSFFDLFYSYGFSVSPRF